MQTKTLLEIVLDKRPILKEEYKGNTFKGKEIGSGLGKLGGLTAVGAGTAALQSTGGKIMLNPLLVGAAHVHGSSLTKNTKYNNLKPSHRIGVLAARRHSAINYGLMGLGALAGYNNADSFNLDKETGMLAGTIPGLARMAHKGQQTAKMQGYGKLGQLGGALTSYTGTFKPKNPEYYDIQRKKKD